MLVARSIKNFQKSSTLDSRHANVLFPIVEIFFAIGYSHLVLSETKGLFFLASQKEIVRPEAPFSQVSCFKS